MVADQSVTAGARGSAKLAGAVECYSEDAVKIVGHVDKVYLTHIHGWACDEDARDQPVSLLILDNDALVARVMANKFRADLLEPKDLGNRGRLAFEVSVTLSPLKRHVIQVISEVTGEALVGSPAVIEPSAAFDAACKTAIANVMAGAATEAEIAERLAFLAGQIEAVLRLSDGRQIRENERAARQALTWRTGAVRAQSVFGSEDQPQEDTASVQGRALVIDLAMPDPGRDAGSVAIVSHMASLQRLGYAVTFLPIDLAGDTTAMERRGILSLTRPWYASVEEALARHNGFFDLVYLHRSEIAGPYLQLARRYQARAHLVFSVADLASLRTERQADVEGRPELKAWARHLADTELTTGRQADGVITHSLFEASILRRFIEANKVHVVPFAVSERPTLVPLSARSGLAFIGGFAHRPNVDAARWLKDEIMPKIALSHPSIACHIVGSSIPDHIRQLASDTYIPVGAVEDLSVIFDRVRVTIAPLAFGAGVKGKVLSSLAAGVPCVCTPVAAEGMSLPPALQGLIASSSEDLAAIVVRLHEDEEFNQACSDAGLEYIATHCSEGAVDVAMKKATTRVRP